MNSIGDCFSQSETQAPHEDIVDRSFLDEQQYTFLQKDWKTWKSILKTSKWRFIYTAWDTEHTVQNLNLFQQKKVETTI